jgi:hypothetical protein
MNQGSGFSGAGGGLLREFHITIIVANWLAKSWIDVKNVGNTLATYFVVKAAVECDVELIEPLCAGLHDRPRGGLGPDNVAIV